MFELVMTNGEKDFSLFYDPHTSNLLQPDGQPAIQNLTPKQYKDIFPVSPEDPGKKDANKIDRLKIQMGLSCNYSCSYCLQRHEVDKAAKASTNDAKMFLFHLDKWLKSIPRKIEFWGGEPLLYWNKIEILHAALKEKFPEAQFSMITNGALLTKDIVNYLADNKFWVAISHDGPGQMLRGPDPLDDKELCKTIKYMLKKMGDRFAFNAVLSPISYDVEKIEHFFKSRFGKKTRVSFEGVIINYEDDMNIFTDEQYGELTRIVAKACSRSPDQIPSAFANKMQRFFESLNTLKPSSALSQKCGMDTPSSIAVDLLGNVTTCQNVGGEGKHKIGHVFNMEGVKLNTSWHWSKRKECSNCPLLQLCAGSCMYNEGKSWYYSCNNEYAYNLGILAGCMYHMFGLVLKEVKGEIYRPDPAEYGITDV